MIIKNEIRGEEFLVFYSFSLSLNVSLKEIAMMYIGLQNSFVSIERFFSYEEECEYILNEEKKLIGLKKDDEINSLYVNNINFSFDNRKLLNNLSIASSKGKIIGIIGENGTGKTTILKLIMKIYKTQLGEIMLNDYNINDISFESIRQYITYVTPEPIIYEGTILENIILANSYASSKDIEVMIKIMNLKKDIMKMPQNINTKIDNSLKLSTGQKKKIQLIRCLLRNTLIYLFDEPTSGLDENTKFNFRVLLSQIKKHKIIFMISHDKEDLKLCDYVIKLNNIIDNK